MTVGQKTYPSHELQVLVVNGEAKPLSPQVVLSLMRFRPFQAAIATLVLLLGLADARDFAFAGSVFVGSVLLWLSAAAAVLGLWAVQAAVLGYLTRKRTAPVVIRSLWLHIVPIAAVAGLFELPGSIGARAPEAVTLAAFALETGRLYLIALFCEFLVLRTIEPSWSKHWEEAVRPPEDTEGMAKSIPVPGGAVRTEGLSYLKSAEHYIEFHKCDGGQEMHRLALRDAVSLMRDEDGVQTHRSYWVFRHSIDRLARRGAHWALVLQDGSETPIARNRVMAVREWLGRWTDKA